MWQLTWKSEYGLLFLAALSKSEPGSYIPLKVIAINEQLPYRFLSQIATTLKKHGIIGSKEGSNGGYFLRRHPADITFYDVVTILENSDGLVACQGNSGCPKLGLCAMREMWRTVNLEMTGVLEKHTVAELIS